MALSSNKIEQSTQLMIQGRLGQRDRTGRDVYHYRVLVTATPGMCPTWNGIVPSTSNVHATEDGCGIISPLPHHLHISIVHTANIGQSFDVSYIAGKHIYFREPYIEGY